MKLLNILFCLFLFVAVTNGKEESYTGSTPADAAVIRTFFNIPVNDSIDFMRWQLVLNDTDYKLNCNYGIGKPNTNGFINGGKKIELRGALNKEKNYCLLQNGNKHLKLIKINANLLHFLDGNNNLLVGNGGWSYTLNNTAPLATNAVNHRSQETILKDSIVFQGRTPCGIPGIPKSTSCYKIKWYIVLYANNKSTTNTYTIKSTLWRSEGEKTGKWKIVTEKDGRIIYQLNDENNNVLLHLLKLDENILVFTDGEGKLLVGDEDFSYTLNRVVIRS